MLSQLSLLLVLIASSRNVESSTGSGVIGNNGKEISPKIYRTDRRQNVNQNRKVGAEERFFVISRSEGKSNKFNYHRRIRLWHDRMRGGK